MLSVGNSEQVLWGLQYQRWVTDRFALGVSGGIVAYDNEYTDKYYCNYNVNITANINIFNFEWGDRSGSRFGAFFLAGHRGFYGDVSEYKYSYNGPDKTGYFPNVVFAAGLEIEFLVWQRISMPVQLGFSGEFPNFPTAGVCFGTGLRYVF